MKYPKRSQYKYAKSRYRVRNWAEYEAGLQKRGDLTVWLSDAALDGWRAPASGKPCGQRTYANVAIEAALTIRMAFHLPLRQTEGFLRSLAQLFELDLTGRRTGDSARVPALLGQIEHRVASVSADGAYDARSIRAQATASAAWWRTPGTVTRRSSVEGCQVEPSLDNELRYSSRARSSTR